MTIGFFGLLASVGAVAVAAFVGEFEGEPKVMAGAIGATGVTSEYTANVLEVGCFHEIRNTGTNTD